MNDRSPSPPVLLPEVEELLELFASIPVPDFADMSPQEARDLFVELRVAPDNLPEVSSIDDTVIPGPAGPVPVRIYRPEQAGPLPAIVWLHGGGWVLGDLETGDLACRTLTNQAQCAVVSVDYRLAPETRFPGPFEDCLAATRWVWEHAAQWAIDPDRVAIGGDSAGGNLAACVALAATDLPLCFQLLVYPVIAADFDNDSYQRNGSGYFLTRAGMEAFWDHYTDPHQRDDPRVAPLNAEPEQLAQVPPAWIFTAGFDPLCQEGHRFAEALEAAGVTVERAHRDDVVHGVFGMTLTCSEEIRQQAAHALKRALHRLP